MARAPEGYTLGDWVSDNWENQRWGGMTKSPERARERGDMYSSMLFGGTRQLPAKNFTYFWDDDGAAPYSFNPVANYARPDAATLDSGIAQRQLPGPEWRRAWADEIPSSLPEASASPAETPLRRSAGATIRSEKYRTERRQAQSEATMRAADASMFNPTETTKPKSLEEYKPRGFSGKTLLHGPGTLGPVSY